MADLEACVGTATMRSLVHLPPHHACLLAVAILAFGCTPEPGVVSDLDVQNLSAETVYIDYGFYFEIPSGSGGFVASFSGPEPAAWEVPVYRADCTLLAVVIWNRGRDDLTLRVNHDLTTDWISGSVDLPRQVPETEFRTSLQCPP